MADPPLVGITGSVDRARYGVWDRPTVLSPAAYASAVAAAGGVPVVLPPLPDPSRAAGSVVARLDALVLSGGADLDPRRYGAEPSPRTTGVDPARDASEFALLAAALERDLPVLGVCRGVQLMCAAAGGALVQHLPDALGSDRHRPGPARYGRHGVRLDPASRLGAALGERVEVASYHHQGLLDSGRLRVVGWADDGTPEAVEDDGRAFVAGVLWHPEVDADTRAFAALVRAARRV